MLWIKGARLLRSNVVSDAFSIFGELFSKLKLVWRLFEKIVLGTA